MSAEMSTENEVYEFQLGERTYSYRKKNKRLYSNEEFANFLQNAGLTSGYYNEPCTIWNDYDGDLVLFPRNALEDRVFLWNVQLVLKHTKSAEQAQLLNKILNESLIIDEEPVLKDAKLGYTASNLSNPGSCHVDVYKINRSYIDSINLSARKIQLGKSKSEEKKEIAILEKI